MGCMIVNSSECLADADEVLCCAHTRNRLVQIVSDVDADWADGCGVTQADADVVRIERSEIVKADAWKYIPTVVETERC